MYAPVGDPFPGRTGGDSRLCGVLIIPKEIKDEVIEKALIKASGEKTVRKAIEGGMTATQAFVEFGIL